MRGFLALAVCLALAAACGRGGTGTIEGTVSAPGGVIPGATVEAYLKPGTRTGEKPLSVTVTDENGRFSLALPRGTYYLAARADNPGGGPRLTGAPSAGVDISRGGERVVTTIEVRARGEGDSEAETVMLSGRVVRDGEPVAGAAVSTYAPGHPTSSGPGSLASGISGGDGRFSFPVPVTPQGVTARLRTGAVKVGALLAGDLSSGEPVLVEPRAGRPVDVGDLPIRPLRSERLEARKGIAVAGIPVEGLVRDGDGRPLAGLFAMAYRNPDMTAKPAAISEPTGADGRFRLLVPGRGTYYLGVRSRPGGPVTPGETMGSYQETPDHSIVIGDAPVSGLAITAERML